MDTAQHRQINQVLLSGLYGNAKPTFAATLIAGTVLYSQFLNAFPVVQLTVWYGLLMGINIGRLILAAFYNRSDIRKRIPQRRWFGIFFLGLIFSTATWSCGALIFFPYDSTFLLSIYLLGFLGIASGGTFTLGSSLRCVAVHSPLITSVVGYQFVSHWASTYAMGANIIVLFVFIFNYVLLSAAHRYRNALIEQTRLRITNERLIKRLRYDKNRAVSENRAKSAFLATMSHELRTPLNGILGMIQVLRDEVKQESSRSSIETMYRSAKALLNILNEILDYSKISAGKLELESVSFDWVDLINDVAQLMKAYTEKKGLVFDLVLEGSETRRLKGDPVRLRQILINLLDNSIKFTEQGRVTLEVRAKPNGTDKCELAIHIRDTGIGIEEKEKKRIFSKFSQADSSTTRRYGGTGLGLTISQRLAHLMKTEIVCASQPGHGTEFSLNPVFGIDPETPQASGEAEKLSDLWHKRKFDNSQNYKVLVVDDDAVSRKVSALLLNKLGYKCELLTSGIETVERLKNTRWDLIFLDYQMPEMDGLETARAIRKWETGSEHHTYLVACTANLSDEDRLQCKLASMDDFVGKPVLLNELTAVLERWNHCLHEENSLEGQAE